MIKSTLSDPLTLQGESILDKVTNAYAVFNNVFGYKQFRPEYDNKFIFLNSNKQYQGQQLLLPERFMHITSIEDKSTYNIYPCNNDITYSMCQNKCSPRIAHPEYQKINRSECLYRLSRVHWIPEIINLANNSDPNIQKWTKMERDSKGNFISKDYIRYEKGIIDYVIILKKDVRRGIVRKYDFVTSFPVFTKRNKIQFASDYNTYIKNKKSASYSTPK